jgi:hypothetical protein
MKHFVYNMQGFLVLSDILQAVRCQATSSATRVAAKPIIIG